VGGGHAQSVGPLVEAGHAVTVLGSDPVCEARVRPWLGSGRARFATGELLALPFEKGSFDVVLAYRLLPHVTCWPELVREMCRVAYRAVVVDYPTRRSVNAVADLLFALKKKVEGNTRPFTVFADSQITQAFEGCGLKVASRAPEFFWPMALHRGLGSAALSRSLEGVAAGLGLTRAFGSPVILKATRG
jgi:hypothetical protein